MLYMLAIQWDLCLIDSPFLSKSCEAPHTVLLDLERKRETVHSLALQGSGNVSSKCFRGGDFVLPYPNSNLGRGFQPTQ